MANAIDITGKEFRRMQLIQLDLLIELDRVCRKHGINYVISCGSLLGAVRHKGYIPWDDDADIAMTREDYEKFKCVTSDLNPQICFFQDHTTDREYRWGYGKLRRTGTKFIRAGQEHIYCKTGVFIDIFPLDDVPQNTLCQMLQDFHCFCLRKILWSEVGKYQAKGFWKIWFSLLSHISVDWVYKQLKPYVNKSNNRTDNYVRVLLFPSFGKLYRKAPLKLRYGFPKKWLLERAEYEFEGHMLYGIKDYNSFLSFMYGDYMKLPPENKRNPHAPVSSYDFAGLHEKP